MLNLKFARGIAQFANQLLIQFAVVCQLRVPRQSASEIARDSREKYINYTTIEITNLALSPHWTLNQSFENMISRRIAESHSHGKLRQIVE